MDEDQEANVMKTTKYSWDLCDITESPVDLSQTPSEQFEPCHFVDAVRDPLTDQAITILHAKVAQKSYGSEKRFFCPPPCVSISCRGWRLMQDHLEASCFGDFVHQVNGFMSLDNTTESQMDAFRLVFEEQPDSKLFACAKTLYISDQDKRKHFRLLLRLFLVGRRHELGSFHSRLIKVISKPSQKRQSMKNADLCISSCSRVAMFNRLRSQTVSTRYLSVEGGAFVASSRHWTAFTIIIVAQRGNQVDFTVSDTFISYGCVVQLVCTETGVALPPMVIRKVNKQQAVLDVNEPVSQLHKCALQFRDRPNSYLCLVNDNIVQYHAQLSAKDPSRVVLNDGSCWTIIGVESVEFSFKQGLASFQNTISPFPAVHGLEVNGGGHVAMLEIHGDNFSPHVKVWFGDHEAETMFKSAKSLVCVVPDISGLSDGWRCLRRSITVPLSIVRLDGLIYRTPYSFTYTPELQLVPALRGPEKAQGPESSQQEHDGDDLLEFIHQEFTRANFHLFMQN